VTASGGKYVAHERGPVNSQTEYTTMVFEQLIVVSRPQKLIVVTGNFFGDKPNFRADPDSPDDILI
jgi:hypothetical protein